jgi:hypothetical protein
MSRGLGRVEQQILAATEKDELLDVPQLIERIYQIEPHEGNVRYDAKQGKVVTIIPEACLVSVRRALRSLLRKGMIARLRGFRGGWYKYANVAYAEQYCKKQDAEFAMMRARMRQR